MKRGVKKWKRWWHREIRKLSVAEAPEFHGKKVAYSDVPFDFAQGTPSASLSEHNLLR